ncbi:hypothetical protein ACJX0J_041304, partial [Zea mays]
DWPTGDMGFKPETLQCSLCGTKLCLVAQVHAPVAKLNIEERIIYYLFVLRVQKCHNHANAPVKRPLLFFFVLQWLEFIISDYIKGYDPKRILLTQYCATAEPGLIMRELDVSLALYPFLDYMRQKTRNDKKVLYE